MRLPDGWKHVGPGRYENAPSWLVRRQTLSATPWRLIGPTYRGSSHRTAKDALAQWEAVRRPPFWSEVPDVFGIEVDCAESPGGIGRVTIMRDKHVRVSSGGGITVYAAHYEEDAATIRTAAALGAAPPCPCFQLVDSYVAEVNIGVHYRYGTGVLATLSLHEHEPYWLAPDVLLLVHAPRAGWLQPGQRASADALLARARDAITGPTLANRDMVAFAPTAQIWPTPWPDQRQHVALICIPRRGIAVVWSAEYDVGVGMLDMEMRAHPLAYSMQSALKFQATVARARIEADSLAALARYPFEESRP